jgi:DNA-binding HxlR family transcriptional regulator
MTAAQLPEAVRRIFRVRGGIEVLFYLKSTEATSKRNLCKELGPSPPTVAHTLDALQAWGLVASTPLDRFPFSRSYSLTPFGRALVTRPIEEWPELVRASRSNQNRH